MADFEQECYRLSHIADPSGTAERDWQNREGHALKMVLKEVERLFMNQSDLKIDISHADPKEPILLVMAAGSRMKPLVAFKFRPHDTKVTIWPVQAPGSGFAVEKNPKSIVVDGGWDEEALGGYFADVFSRLG